MANFKSDLITANDQIDISDKMVNGDRTGGLVLLATAIVTLSSSTAANDTFQLFDLPAGAVIIPQLSYCTGADPGTTLTLHVGDAGAATRYANGITMSNGGQVGFCSGVMPAAVAAPLQATANTRIIATASTAGTVTDAVKLSFTIAYRIK